MLCRGRGRPVDAVAIFFVPYYVYAGTFDVWGNSSGSEGKSDGLWIFGSPALPAPLSRPNAFHRLLDVLVGTTVYTVLVVSMFARCALLT